MVHCEMVFTYNNCDLLIFAKDHAFKNHRDYGKFAEGRDAHKKLSGRRTAAQCEYWIYISWR
jgi:hypothetical protein